MHFKILTLFPEAIAPYLNSSILGRAQASGLIKIDYFNIRDYSLDKHRRVDDTPYGGGYGMLMTPQPILDCHKAACETLSGRTRTIYFSPAGQKLDHAKALELKEYDNLILLCGHYEGIDERVTERIVDEEISIGDYVLSGGELPCAVLVDAVSRLIDRIPLAIPKKALLRDCLNIHSLQNRLSLTEAKCRRFCVTETMRILYAGAEKGRLKRPIGSVRSCLTPQSLTETI